MTAVFLKLLNMSIAASWLVLAVILLRFVLKKAPKAIVCVLWALVGIRLVLPFSIESVMSLIPSAETVPADIVYAAAPSVSSGIPIFNSTVNPLLQEYMSPSSPSISSYHIYTPMELVTFGATVIWIAGMLAMAIYATVSYVRIRRRVRASVPFRGVVRLCDDIDTPFILGIFRPHVYLPSAMDGREQDYVIAHEQAHLKRRDHWWKPLGFVLLTVYWFNPVLWLAYILLCRDIEVACDEKVIKDMAAEDKRAYTAALLNCSVPRKMVAACPLAFGEVGVKSRIKNVLNYKRPAFWIIMAAVITCIAAAVCFLTDPLTPPSKEINGYSYTVKQYYYAHISDLSYVNEERLNNVSYAVTDDYRLLETEYGQCEDWGYLFEDDERAVPLYKKLNRFVTYRYIDIGYSKLWLAESEPHITGGSTSLFLMAVMNNDDVICATFYPSQGEWELRYVFELAKGKRYSPNEQQRYAGRYQTATHDIGYTESGAIYTDALNPERLNDSTQRHLPIHKITSLNQWKAFLEKTGNMWDALLTAYDEAMLDGNTLFAVYVTSGSGSNRYGVHSVYNDGHRLQINVIQTNDPEAGTADMAGWLLTVLVDDRYVDTCTTFDAVYEPYYPVDPFGFSSATETLPNYSRAYRYEAFQASALKPTLLLTGTDESKEGYFRFLCDPLQNQILNGRYQYDGECIYLYPDSQSEVYTFWFASEENALFFNEERSARLPYSAESIPDNAPFLTAYDGTLEGTFSSAYGSAYGDIDGDGEQEYCTMGYGSTSGLFTFTFTAYDNDGEKYFTVFCTEAYKLSFVKDANGNLLVRGITQEGEIHYFTISVKENTIVLEENGTYLAY